MLLVVGINLSKIYPKFPKDLTKFKHVILVIFFFKKKKKLSSKGVQGSECMTRHRLVSPAFGHQGNFWNPLYFRLKAAQNIDLRTLGYVNSLVVASNVMPADYRAIKAI